MLGAMRASKVVGLEILAHTPMRFSMNVMPSTASSIPLPAVSVVHLFSGTGLGRSGLVCAASRRIGPTRNEGRLVSGLVGDEPPPSSTIEFTAGEFWNGSEPHV